MIDLNQYMTGASPYDGAIALKYDEGDYSLEVTPPNFPYTDNDKQHTVLDGETLQSIAHRYYGDSGKWYLIAEANNILNPFQELEPYQILRIPMYGGN
jgi:nucleoid-associated protein YgaU